MTRKVLIILAGLALPLMMTACSRTQQGAQKPAADTLSACGPKALSVVIAYYRLDVSWDSLAKVCLTTGKGTSLLDLANGA